VFFPEASDFIGNPTAEALELSHPLPSGPFLEGMCAEAKQLGIWCSVGIHEKVRVRERECVVSSVQQREVEIKKLTNKESVRPAMCKIESVARSPLQHTCAHQ